VVATIAQKRRGDTAADIGEDRIDIDLGGKVPVGIGTENVGASENLVTFVVGQIEIVATVISTVEADRLDDFFGVLEQSGHGNSLAVQSDPQSTSGRPLEIQVIERDTADSDADLVGATCFLNRVHAIGQAEDVVVIPRATVQSVIAAAADQNVVTRAAV